MLDAIINWLDSNNLADECEAAVLTDCINLERLSYLELQTAVKMCSHETLKKFRDSCVDRIVEGSVANFTTTKPIDYTQRLAYRRDEPLLSLKTCFFRNGTTKILRKRKLLCMKRAVYSLAGLAKVICDVKKVGEHACNTSGTAVDLRPYAHVRFD